MIDQGARPRAHVDLATHCRCHSETQRHPQPSGTPNRPKLVYIRASFFQFPTSRNRTKSSGASVLMHCC